MRETLRVGGVAVSILCDEPGVGALVHGAERLFLAPDAVADFSVPVHLLEHYERPRGAPLFGPTPYKIAVFDEALTHADVFATKLTDPLEFPLGELLLNALLTRRGA